MISAGFVHLLGAAVQELDPTAVFPLAPFLCGLGFILTLIADHAAGLLSCTFGRLIAQPQASASKPNLAVCGSVDVALQSF